MSVNDFVSYRERLVGACSKAIVGKDDKITLIAVCYLCGGHILLDDVPGTGKTMLFRAFAKASGGSFKRIQFTPDVMPSDITGINFYNMKTGEFEVRPGPVFADMDPAERSAAADLLADVKEVFPGAYIAASRAEAPA